MIMLQEENPIQTETNIEKLKRHKISESFSTPITKELRETIKDDVRQFGQKRNVILFQGAVLDGMIIYEICLELYKEIGLECKFEAFKGSEQEAIQYCMRENVKRRSITASQRAAMAINFKHSLKSEYLAYRAKHGGRSKNKLGALSKNSNRETGKMFGCSTNYIQLAYFIWSKKPELIKEILDGKVKIYAAAKIVQNGHIPKKYISSKRYQAREASPEQDQDRLSIIGCMKLEGWLFESRLDEGGWKAHFYNLYGVRPLNSWLLTTAFHGEFEAVKNAQEEAFSSASGRS